MVDINRLNAMDGVDYDPQTGRCDVDLTEWDSLTAAIIDVLAALTDNQPETMDPLYDVVDPDALDALFHSQSEQIGRIQFHYGGHDVTMQSEGQLIITEPDDTE
jgi:hypothetical protein